MVPTGWVRRPVVPAHAVLASAFRRSRPTGLAEALQLLGEHAVRRAPCSVRSIGTHDVAGATFATLLEGSAATVIRSVLPAAESARLARAVDDARHEAGRPHLWALGVPWFAYGAARAEQYAAVAAEENAAIGRRLPGLHARLAAWCADVQGEPVEVREGWGGPGIVVFPAADSAGPCGDIHIDWEGVIHEPSGLNTEIYSLISIVSKPEQGGGLRVWGLGVRSHDHINAPDPASFEDTVIEYEPGDVVVIRGMDLHQIDAFGGNRDRAALTFHLARLEQGWRIWL